MNFEGTPKTLEIFLMKLATGLTVAYAAGGIGIAVLCDSMTMMVDGLYSLVDVVVSVIAIFAVRKIHEPPDERYHFGYAKYEPFMTAVDGLLIMAICAVSIVSSIQDIVHPDPVKHLGLIVGYSLLSVFVCCGFGVYIRRAGRRISSPLLITEGQIWVIEGVISAGVCAAFALQEMISATYWKRYADYIDPIMCIVLSLALLYEPIRIVGRSFRDLVDARPEDEIQRRIEGILEELGRTHGLAGIAWMKTRKAGRKIFATVCFKTEQDRPVREMEKVRNALTAELEKRAPEMSVDVLFHG